MNDPIERSEELPASEFVDFGRITDETKGSGLPPYVDAGFTNTTKTPL